MNQQNIYQCFCTYQKAGVFNKSDGKLPEFVTDWSPAKVQNRGWFIGDPSVAEEPATRTAIKRGRGKPGLQ